MREAIASDSSGARVHWYRRIPLIEWTLAGAGLALWTRAHRLWASLVLRVPSGWRLCVSLVLVASLLWLWWNQRRKATALTAERRAAHRERIIASSLSFILPHTADELRWFMAVSATAGVCEELLFRGYLAWVLTPWLGFWVAGALGAVLFGFAHAYQGRTGIVSTAVLGAVFSGVVLVMGSILPGMVLHALVDMTSGTTIRDPAGGMTCA